MRVLYISYTGLMEPLGQSQVLQYLKRLASEHTITLVSFERPGDWSDAARRDAMEREVRAAGLRWLPLPYHPGGAGSAVDIARGLATCLAVAVRHRVEVVHARSYIPGLIALGLKRTLGVRFLFDMRGFWGDERVDGGIWPQGSRAYRVVKRLEARLLLGADVVVSLTHAGVEAMRRFPYLSGRDVRFEVIPTCTNLELFRRAEGADRAGGPDADAFRLGYVGTVGTWYLFDPVLECFGLLREHRPGARLVVVNRGDHEYIRERMAAHGVPADSVEIRAVHYAAVPQEMSRMDAGIFFIKPVFSKLASAPTKLGEFLGCGVPCLSNAGVGDVEAVLEGEGVGVVLRGFDRPSQEAAVGRLLAMAESPQIRERCAEAAHRHFSLDRGVAAYDRIYRSLQDPARLAPLPG